MTITVQLPKLKLPGQCLSTTEVIAKLKQKALPHEFKALAVSKTTLEFIRFEGEVSSKMVMELVISKLNRIELKTSGFTEVLKVKCAPLKIGTSKYEWETYFRDNPQIDEKKAGYRPDTIHVTNLPVKCFGGNRPKTDILLQVFSSFGEIRRFHVPLLDEIEMGSNNSFKKFSHSESPVFDAFIMYKDYVAFVKAMESLSGMKLVHKAWQEGGEVFLEYDIAVDFDNSRHLSDKAIRKRKLEKEYGIKNSDEVKKLEEDTKKRREEYETRIKQLVDRKNQAKRLLKLIFERVSEKEAQTKKQEPQLSPEQKVPVCESAKHEDPDPDSSSPITAENNEKVKWKERKEEKERLLEKERQLREELMLRTADVSQKVDSNNKLTLKSVVAAAEHVQRKPVDQVHSNPKTSLRSVVNCHNMGSSRVTNSHHDHESTAVAHHSEEIVRSLSSGVKKRSLSPPIVRSIRKKIVFDRSPERGMRVTKLVITTQNDDFLNHD